MNKKLILLKSVTFVFICYLFFFPSVIYAQQKLHISGYGNMHYMDHNGMPVLTGAPDLNKGNFQIREFTLFFDFAITDAIIASTELEAGDNGTRYTANYAYVDVEVSENFSFRAGKILVPFLSYNENKPNFKQYLMSQPFTAWNVVPVNGVASTFHGFGWGDVGISLNWQQSIEDLGALSFKFSLINGIGSSSNVLDDNFVQLEAGEMKPFVRTRDGLIQNRGITELLDNNNNKAMVIKASFRSVELPLELGASWYRGAWDNEDKNYLTMQGLYFNWLTHNYTLKGEYVIANVEQEGGTDLVADAGMTGPSLINLSTGDYTMNAYYIEASYVPLRWEQDRYFRLVTRYDDVDTNDKAVFTPFNRYRITAGLEWQFASNTRFRYEYQHSILEDFDKAPLPFKMAGGKETIQMHMGSFIFAF